MPRRTRRELLRGTAGASTIVLLAGCGGQPDETTATGADGDGDDGGTDTATASPEPEMGPPVELTMIVFPRAADPLRFQMNELIVEELENLGVVMNFQPLAPNQVVQRLAIKHDYQLGGVGYGGNTARLDPDAFLYEFFHSSSIEEAQNFMEYSNEELDAAIEAQRAEFDFEQRREHVRRAQEIINEEVPMIVYATRDFLAAYRSDRFENPAPMVGQGLMSFWNLIEMTPTTDVERLTGVDFTDISNLNPLFGSSVDYQVYNLIYDKLMRISRETLRPEPWAAETVDVVDDTTIDVALREGLRFHDGEPVTTADVKFTFEYVAEHSPQFRTRVQPVDSIETDGETSMTFNLAEPFAPFLHLGLGSVPILPQHIWEGVPDDVDAEEATSWPNSEAIGSGPYQFDHWRKGEEVGLTRNPDHFNPPEAPAFVKLVVADVQSVTRRIEAGGADFTVPNQVPVDSIQRLADQEGIDIVQVPNIAPTNITFHTGRQPGNDVAFRRAVANVIPRQDIVETILSGFGTIEPDSVITSPNESWHNPDLPQRTLDREAARQILVDAGYTWDDQDRLRYPADA